MFCLLQHPLGLHGSRENWKLNLAGLTSSTMVKAGLAIFPELKKWGGSESVVPLTQLDQKTEMRTVICNRL